MPKPKIVVFTMEGCPACVGLKPHAAKIATHYKSCIDTDFANIEVDVRAMAYEIESVPQILGFDQFNKPIVRLQGWDGDEDVQRLIKFYNRMMEEVSACSIEPFKDV